MIATGNPFVSAYAQADWLGRLVFCSLFLLSAISWWILIHKTWIYVQVRRLSNEFMSQFSEKDPLGLQFIRPLKERRMEVPHPFFEVYKTMKQNVLQTISKNHFY